MESSGLATKKPTQKNPKTNDQKPMGFWVFGEKAKIKGLLTTFKVNNFTFIHMVIVLLIFMISFFLNKIIVFCSQLPYH